MSGASNIHLVFLIEHTNRTTNVVSIETQQNYLHYTMQRISPETFYRFTLN